jgi:hypothetical protein
VIVRDDASAPVAEIERDTASLDRRVLVAAPLVCHLIGRPKRHFDPDSTIAASLLIAVPPVRRRHDRRRAHDGRRLLAQAQARLALVRADRFAGAVPAERSAERFWPLKTSSPRARRPHRSAPRGARGVPRPIPRPVCHAREVYQTYVRPTGISVLSFRCRSASKPSGGPRTPLVDNRSPHSAAAQSDASRARAPLFAQRPRPRSYGKSSRRACLEER